MFVHEWMIYHFFQAALCGLGRLESLPVDAWLLFNTEDSEIIMKFQVPRWGETFLWQLEINVFHPSPFPEAVLTSVVGLNSAVF